MEIKSSIYLDLQEQLAEILAISNEAIKPNTLLIRDLKLDDMDIAELGLVLEELYNLNVGEILTREGFQGITFQSFVTWIENMLPNKTT
jgi:acyl carrier protein